MVEFSTGLACQVVARHAIYEVPLRATLECLVQSALRRRGSEHLQREYRRLRSTTLKKLLATTRCGAAMADGVATIPSIRPNGARSGLSDQLAQAVQSSSAGGVNLDHFGEEFRFENDSVLLAMVGIIAARAESAEAA